MNKQFERYKLRLLAWLSVISILICITTVILWPLSYATGVQLSVRNGAGTRYAILTTPGQIGLAVVRGEPPAWISMDGGAKPLGSAGSTLTNTNDKLRWFWRPPPQGTLGFAADQGSGTIYFGEVNASVKCDYSSHFMPIWLVSILTAVGPILWYKARQRRQYRLENDLCIYCGSDMSTSPYRCPGCGKEPQW